MKLGLNKQNIENPKKQGILYEISTGKDNGAYLAKDIAEQNNRSLKLLTISAQESHKSYVSTLQLVNKKQQGESIKMSSMMEVENFGKNYEFDLVFVFVIQKEISKMKEVLILCGGMSKNIRAELNKMKQGQGSNLSQLQNSALPALKSLKQKMKEYKNEQIATYSKVKSELQKIGQSFDLIGGVIKQC